MTNDYIRRQDAIRWVKTECNPYGKPTLDFESGKRVIEHLERMPSADVVPVVRCKDCKYYDDTNTDFRHCEVLYDGDGYMMTTEPDDFCSYGEKRED